MIAIVVPTMESRKEIYEKFLEAWKPLFDKHKVCLLKVTDGEIPTVTLGSKTYDINSIMGSHARLIFNKNDGVRNLGFAFIAKFMPTITKIITLDDDVLPYGDSIQGHLDALNAKVPLCNWINTLKDVYPRGFPYGIRSQAPVMVSHGLWNTVLDLDAATQLVMGTDVKSDYNKFAVPRGVYIPFCGMSVAFNREVLKYMYYAPMGPRVGLDRFADIYMGVVLKDKLDSLNWAMVTGYSEVIHNRASNVFNNLMKEAKGLSLHETWNDDYFKLYAKKRKAWEKLINKYIQG